MGLGWEWWGGRGGGLCYSLPWSFPGSGPWLCLASVSGLPVCQATLLTAAGAAGELITNWEDDCLLACLAVCKGNKKHGIIGRALKRRPVFASAAWYGCFDGPGVDAVDGSGVREGGERGREREREKERARLCEYCEYCETL